MILQIHREINMVGLKISNSPYIKSELGYSYFWLLDGIKIRSFGHVEGGIASLGGYLYDLDNCKVIYPHFVDEFKNQLTKI